VTGANGQRIEISAGDVTQIAAQWQLQRQRPPTPEELQSAIDARVREEVFARRARDLGLDRDDAVIRRRLAQKLEFVSEDLAATRQPSEAELSAFFSQRRAHYTLPPRVSFRQIYFSSERRGPRAKPDAVAALAKLASDDSAADLLGDPFLLDPAADEMTLDDVARSFGPEIAKAVVGAAIGQWQGPVASTYGWHLLEVNQRDAARNPDLAEVREQVLRDWSDAARLRANEEVFRSLVDRYEIVVNAPPVEIAQAAR